MLLALGTAALARGAQDAASSGGSGTGGPSGVAPATAPSSVAPAGVELSARVIDLGGKVQWRPTADAAWQPANLNDVIPSGSEVRTGLRSHAALRIGPNATALIDAGTVFQLPSAVRDGDVLRTTVAVKSGRADFKVDKVGLTNDFKVVTPSTTLAVRGTSFAIATGALKQVEVVGARTNTMRAIELKYALSNTTVALSGSATSSSTVQQPAHSAVVATAPPVVAAAAPPATSAAETVVQASTGPSPAAAGSPAQSQQANSTTAKAEATVTNTKPETDGNSLLAVINRALVTKAEDLAAASDRRIADAHGRVTSAIHAMLADVEEDPQSATHLEALAALRDLAAAKRDLAREALEQVAVARGAGPGEGVAITGRSLPEQVTSFDARAAESRDAADALAEVVSAAGDGESAIGEYEGRVADAAGTEAARLVAALRSMDASLGEARLSLAIVALQSAVQEGADARGMLSAARTAVAEATQVVQDLAASRAAPQLVALASRARDQLAQMTSDLAQASAARDAVAGSLAQAATDADRARFAGLAQLADNLLAARARLIGEWAQWNAALARRDAGADTGADETGLGLAGGSFVASLRDSLDEGQDRVDALSATAAERATARADSAESSRDAAAASVSAIEDEILAWETGLVPGAQSLAADADARAASAGGSLVSGSAVLGEAPGDGADGVGMESDAVAAAERFAEASDGSGETDHGARAGSLAQGAGALERLAESLVALRGHDDDVREAVGDLEAQRAAVEDVLARAMDAVDRMALHAAGADGHATESEAHASAAAVAAGAASQLLALAEELESLFGDRYGFDASGVRASSDAADAESARAGAAAAAAGALRTLAAELADRELEVGELESLLAGVSAVLDGNEASRDASGGLLARGRDLVADGVVAGARSAGDLARDARDAALETRDEAEGRASDASDAVAARADAQASAESKSVEVDTEASAFDGLRAEFDAELGAGGVFAGEAQAAREALEALQADFGNARTLLGQDDQGGADDDRVSLSEALSAALLQMERSIARADVSLGSMLEARDAIAGIVDSLDPEEESQLASAIAAYESALESLDSAVDSATGHASVAQAADEAVSRMEALLAGLSAADLPDDLRATADEALASFRADASTLAEVAGLLADVTGLRGGAAGQDLEAWQSSLAGVTAAMRAVADRTDGDAAIAEGMRGERNGELAAIASEAEDVLGEVASLLADEADGRRALAAASAGEAEVILAGAVALSNPEGVRVDGAVALAGRALTPDELERSAFAEADALAAAADERNADLAIDGVRFFLKANAFDAAVGRADDRMADALDADASNRLAEAIRLRDALDGVEAIIAGQLGLEELNGRVQLSGADVRRYEALPGLVEQANSAIEALLGAAAGIDGRVAASSDAAAAAAGRAEGLGRIATAVAELREGLGLSDSAFAKVDAALAAASAHAGDAEASRAAAESARASLATVLSRVFEADREVGRVEALASVIEGRLAEGDEIAAGVADTLGVAREDFVRVNEDGAFAFAELALRASDDVVALDALVADRIAVPLAELGEMHVLSGAYVARLDGAQSAANRAEDARDRAFDRRQLAEFHESQSVTGLKRTLDSLGLGFGGLAAASDHAVATLGSAEASRLASDAATAFFLVAKDASVEASGHQAAANAIAPDLFKYGNSQAQFDASGAARAGAVQARSAAESAAADAILRDEVEFFDGIVNALDGRTGTEATADAALASGDARAVAADAAARLRGYAQQAQQMADAASTNAGRLFGRSMVQYVQRAQGAAGAAEVHASIAAAAAARAEGNADRAITEVEAARSGGATPAQ